MQEEKIINSDRLAKLAIEQKASDKKNMNKVLEFFKKNINVFITKNALKLYNEGCVRYGKYLFEDGFYTENKENIDIEAEIRIILSNKSIIDKEYINMINELDNYLISTKSGFRVKMDRRVKIEHMKMIYFMTEEYYKNLYSCLIL